MLWAGACYVGSLRLLSAGFALVYGLSAVVQLNDPDPVRWFTVYAVAAGVAVAHAAGVTLPRWVPASILGASVLWGVALLATTSDVGAPMDHGPGGVLAYEVVRELLGLGLIAVWMGALTARSAQPVDDA